MLALALVLNACDDGPTAPTSYVQEVAGRSWIAIREPSGLPDARTWASRIEPGSPVLGQLRQIAEREREARRSGALERAESLRLGAARLAAGAVRRPDARVLTAAGAALAEWEGRATERLADDGTGELSRALRDVRSAHTAAQNALDGGDTARAVSEIAAAAERARTFAPAAVALRLLADAEARLTAVPRASPDVARALRLLRAARSALASGDHLRAVRRAMYARQLLEQSTRDRH